LRHTARQILQVPQAIFKVIIDQGVVPEGFTQEQADRIVRELIARKSTFLNGFAPEVSIQLKTEEQVARQALLAELVAPIMPPVVMHTPANAGLSNSKKTVYQDELALHLSKLTNEREAILDMIRRGKGSHHSALDKKFQDLNREISSIDINIQQENWTTLPANILQEEPEEYKEEKLSQRLNAQMQQNTPEHKATPSSVLQAYDVKQGGLTALRAQLEKERILGEKSEDKTVCRVFQFQLPPVSIHFTGRVEVLAHITQTLGTRQGNVVTQSISGLGGVGKTQLAAQYAQLASQNAVCGGKQLHYQAVIWLNAECSLDVQFIVLAETLCGLEKPNTEEAIAAIYRYLQDKHTLIIFDNAIDSASIAPFLPPVPAKESRLDRLKSALLAKSPRNFHTLITSRNPDWGQISSLPLNGFNSQEAIAFVCTRLPNASETDIQILVDTVSNLPLALSQAVAYIAEGHCSLQEYPQQFTLHQLSLGQPVSAQGTVDQTVLTTFLLTFVRLKQTHPVIVPLLNACAYLAAEGILTTWLETGLAGLENENEESCILGQFSLGAFQAGLNQLQCHGLLQSSASGKINMHRLIQHVIRQQLTPDQQQAQIKKILTWLVELSSYVDKCFVEQQRAFIPHLEAVIQQHDQNSSEEGVVLAEVLHSLGFIYFYTLGQPLKGVRLFERALKIFDAHYGPDHYQVFGRCG